MDYVLELNKIFGYLKLLLDSFVSIQYSAWQQSGFYINHQPVNIVHVNHIYYKKKSQWSSAYVSVCQWGDQNPELCAPFDQNSQLRINCYMPTVNQICCETCERLKSRSQYQIPGMHVCSNKNKGSKGTQRWYCQPLILFIT